MFKFVKVAQKSVIKHFFACESPYCLTNKSQFCNVSNVDTDSKIFSGIQPSGVPHLGNYLGAIQHWIQLQNSDKDLTISIVDLHAFTLPDNRRDLKKNILEMTALLLACGLNPRKTVLFQQSTLYQHTELCWYLSCLCTMARLSHLPQYKEKTAGFKDIPLGIFIYPVLQAADILIHRATHVPVGEDQVQHLQLAKDLARIINKKLDLKLPIPKTLIFDPLSCRIKNLENPLKKMSKSELNAKSRIDLTDNESTIHKKIKKAMTDCTHEVFYDPVNRPGISNLINIVAVLRKETVELVNHEIRTLNTVEFKELVASTINLHLAPIRKKYFELINEPQYLIDVLNLGAERAVIGADRTLNEIRQKIGLNLNEIANTNNCNQQKIF